MYKFCETLHLVLKRKWWHLIEIGFKKEEYRDVCGYWATRLLIMPKGHSLEHTDDRNQFVWNIAKQIADETISFKDFKKVCFHLGYTNTTMTYRIDGISIKNGDDCKAYWGAEKGKYYFVISLGEKIDE